MSRQPLAKHDLDAFLTRHPKWTVEGHALTRVFESASFRDAMLLVNEIARIAEAKDHHPDIDIRFKVVTVRLKTHDAGDRITAADTSLAEACELCFESHRAQPHASAPHSPRA